MQEHIAWLSWRPALRDILRPSMRRDTTMPDLHGGLKFSVAHFLLCVFVDANVGRHRRPDNHQS
jgi:hypothetical protein